MDEMNFDDDILAALLGPDGQPDEELLSMLSRLGGYQGQGQMLNQKMGMAQALRSMQMPGPTVDAGRLQVPNIAGALGTGLMQGLGARQMRDIYGQQEKLMAGQGSDRAAFLRKLALRQRRPQVPDMTQAGDFPMTDPMDGMYS